MKKKTNLVVAKGKLTHLGKRNLSRATQQEIKENKNEQDKQPAKE